MVYPDDFEQRIEFTEIRRQLSSLCICTLGQECVDRISFSDNWETVNAELDRTMEFVQVLNNEDKFPDLDFFDLRAALERIRVAGLYLDESELFNLWKSLDAISAITKFFCSEHAVECYPKLHALSEQVSAFPHITAAIAKILTKFGHLKDNASPNLYHIRMDLANTRFSISNILNGILRKAQSEGLIDKDAQPTMRDGRLVLPVVPALKKKIKGIVHDESASGRTVFIEPTDVVEANNKTRELEAAEKREIIKILTEFTDYIRPELPSIKDSYSYLAQIDFIRAKALFANTIGATKPVLEKKCVLDWVQAVHPLLSQSLARHGKKVIPLDVELTSDKSILLISGPNAGGKSVCLKTVGLLQYMLQCGIPIPVRSNSHAGLFKNLMIDIGDQQSITDDISTYSGHLMNMKNMLRACNRQTLLLIDEFGSGTEPGIGGALAESVLVRFVEAHSFGVITTHYQNLKQYADQAKGIVNGAMLYDRQLMQPLYILQIGNPGSSFAVEIARKIGLPEDVIADATQIVGRDYVNADKYLQDIVRDKRYWENKRQNVHMQEKHLDELIDRHSKELQSIEKERKEILRQAKEQSMQLIEESNAVIERTIKTIKEEQAERTATKNARQQLSEFKQDVEERTSTSDADDKITRQMERIKRSQERRAERRKNGKLQNGNTDNQQSAETDTADNHGLSIYDSFSALFHIGDTVRIKGQNTIGKIVKITRNNASVDFNSITSIVKTNMLEHAEAPKEQQSASVNIVRASNIRDKIYAAKMRFKPDLDVRGMRGDDAIQTVTFFLDDALLLGISRVRILHGTGSGILRTLIREYLKTVPAVTHFADEHVQFGGAGITVIDLE